jgi:hypothetical protein
VDTGHLARFENRSAVDRDATPAAPQMDWYCNIDQSAPERAKPQHAMKSSRIKAAFDHGWSNAMRKQL